MHICFSQDPNVTLERQKTVRNSSKNTRAAAATEPRTQNSPVSGQADGQTEQKGRSRKPQGSAATGNRQDYLESIRQTTTCKSQTMN